MSTLRHLMDFSCIQNIFLQSVTVHSDIVTRTLNGPVVVRHEKLENFSRL